MGYSNNGGVWILYIIFYKVQSQWGCHHTVIKTVNLRAVLEECHHHYIPSTFYKLPIIPPRKYNDSATNMTFNTHDTSIEIGLIHQIHCYICSLGGRSTKMDMCSPCFTSSQASGNCSIDPS